MLDVLIERFNRTFLDDVLDAWVFTSLAEVRAVGEEWRLGDSTDRAHDGLGRVPPPTFLPGATSTPESDLRSCA